jgi:hypothetical protein
MLNINCTWTPAWLTPVGQGKKCAMLRPTLQTSSFAKIAHRVIFKRSALLPGCCAQGKNPGENQQGKLFWEKYK